MGLTSDLDESNTVETLRAPDQQIHQSRSVALVLLDVVLIFVLLLLIYSLTYSGTFRIDDEHILIARAQSLAFWDHIQYPQIYGNERVRHLSTISEEVASPVAAIEPGQAFFGSLLYKFASLADLGGVQAYFTLNLFATALTGAMVYLTVHLLGFKRPTASFISLLYGLGTMAWPYSKTAFRDPLAACLVTIALLGWVMLLKRGQRRRNFGLLIFILGLLSALFFKSNILALLPSFFLSALVLVYQRRRGFLSDRTKLLFTFLPIFFLIILSLLVSNPGPLSRFSMQYYVEMFSKYIKNINSQTLLATMGPFFSPAKSLFLFNPIFLLIPWIIFRYWRELQSIALPTILGTFSLAFFQALHLGDQWAGTLVWGLRFMLPILPLLCILLAPWLDGLISNGIDRKYSLPLVLIGFSILIQMSGAFVAWNVPFKAWLETGLDPYSPGSIWHLEYLVIPMHLRAFFQGSSWDISWVRTFQIQREAMILPMLALFLIFLSVIVLAKRYLLVGKGRYRSSFAITFLVLAIGFPIFPSLWLLRSDPAAGGNSPEIEQLVDWTKVEVDQGDLVVVDSYGTNLWIRMMNFWDKSIAWYSLPYEIPGTTEVGSQVGGHPSQAALELFDKLGNEYSRLVYLTSQETPDFALKREENWLQENFVLVKQIEMDGQILSKASIYLPK